MSYIVSRYLDTLNLIQKVLLSRRPYLALARANCYASQAPVIPCKRVLVSYFWLLAAFHNSFWYIYSLLHLFNAGVWLHYHDSRLFFAAPSMIDREKLYASKFLLLAHISFLRVISLYCYLTQFCKKQLVHSNLNFIYIPICLDRDISLVNSLSKWSPFHTTPILLLIYHRPSLFSPKIMLFQVLAPLFACL